MSKFRETAVEWLEKICNDRGYILMSEYFEQAKEMEKKQSENYARFVIECDRQKLPILKFKDWVKL